MIKYSLLFVDSLNKMVFVVVEKILYHKILKRNENAKSPFYRIGHQSICSWMSEQNINITQDLEWGRKGRKDHLWLRIKKQNQLHHNVSWIKDLLVSVYAKVLNGFIIYLSQISQLLSSHLLCQNLYMSISFCYSIIYLYFWFLFFLWQTWCLKTW